MNQKRKDQIKKLERELTLNKIEAKEGVHQLVLILDHLKSGFNISKIIRTAEAFSLREVHIIGTKFFDPYPAKGAIKRVKLYFYQTLQESLNRLKEDNYEVFLMDMKAEKYLHEIKLPKNSAFIFGNEEMGPILDGVEKSQFKLTKIHRKLKIIVNPNIFSYNFYLISR